MPGVYLKLLTGSILSYWHLSCTCNYLFFNRLIFGKWHLCLDNVFPVSRGLPQKKKKTLNTREKRPLLAGKMGIFFNEYDLIYFIFS